MLQGGNRDQTCQNCWRQLPFGFKFLFLSSLIYNVLAMFFPVLVSATFFQGYRVAHQIQLWRLLIPFYPQGMMPMGILNILINFLWLLSIFPPLEKKFSTSYILVQTFLQNLLINITLALISIIVYDIFSTDPQQFAIINYGLFPLCMVFIWYQASQNPDQHTTFCCMPCLIPMKFIPLIILGFCLFFASSLLFALLTASVLGYLQFMHFRRRFLKIPLRFYRRIDTLLPKSITDRPDYVKVQNVESSLQSQCYISGGNAGGNNNPFNRNQNIIQQPQQPNKVEVIGKGVSIGGGSNSNPQNFRGFWASKAQQIQIQPVPKQVVKQGIDPQYFSKQNDSRLQLNLNNSDEKSQEGLQQKDEKKVAKQNLLQ